MVENNNISSKDYRAPLIIRWFISMLFLLQILSVAPIKAQPPPYISPGIKLGYISGKGFTFSAEVTIGIIFSLAHGSVAIGYQLIPEKPKSLIYFAMQGGTLYFGLSRGVVLYNNNGTSGRGSRAAWYYGVPLLSEGRSSDPGSINLGSFTAFPVMIFSWEQLKFPSLATRYSSIGIWGKLLTFPYRPFEVQ